MSIKKTFIVGIIIGLLVPVMTYGQVRITEIMYDPEGSDTKREWIEVFNEGSTAVDLNTYFFFEGNVFHKLVAQGASVLEPGSYAIIVDSIAEVVAEYTGFMGQIFDSAFSLNNTGETISMANASKVIIDTATYGSDMGASNDGNSLQINGGVIIAAGPTFGELNKTESETPISQEDEEDSSDVQTSTSGTTLSGNSSHTQQESVSTYTAPASFKVGIGRKRTVSINTPIEFFAQVSKADVKPRFNWNLGDFTLKKGSKVTHIYEHEGVYEVVLDSKSSGNTVVSRTQVHVVVPDISITRASSSIIFKNNSKQEVNIGGFGLIYAGGDTYTIPQNTIISGKSEIRKKIDLEQVVQDFVYPNGEIYHKFDTI